jgi:chaperone required for assembly of F1-ATPase
MHDLVCYRAEHPQKLVELQSAAWDEVVSLCNTKLGITLNVTTGIISVDQPQEAGAMLKSYVANYNAFQITALHNLTTLLTSVSLALCVFDGDFSPEAAWAKAHVDEDYNISQWGEDYEAEQRRARRWLELQACLGLIDTSA